MRGGAQRSGAASASRCAPGAYCEFSSRICRAQKPLGSSCQSAGECLDGALCSKLFAAELHRPESALRAILGPK